jgi:hypothetical protein
VNRASIIILLAFLLWPSAAREEAAYDKSTRVAHIERTLAAFDAVTDEWLIDTYAYLYVVERNQCQAPLESLTVRCLLEAARRNCQHPVESFQDQCDRVSDVIITTRLSERHFISKGTRFRIVSEHTDYRRAILAELRRRYAALVTEMTMFYPSSGRDQDRTELARAIDGYCLTVSKMRSLSWQHCSAVIIWFIGTSGRIEDLGESQ